MKQRATIRDVAAAAGVSVATVSYVLNGKKKVSEQTRNVVLDVIKELEYVPDLNAKSLSVKDTKLIGVVVPQTEPGSTLMFRNNFYGEILGSIEYHARQYGYHVLISATDVTEDYLNLIRERNLDGVIIIGTYQSEFFEQLRQLDLPVVMVDSYCEYNWFHEVRIDDQKGIYQATKYVLDAGHREVGLVCGLLHEDGVMQKRFRGYQQALAEYGIPFRQEYVFEGNVDYDSGVEIAGRIVRTQKDLTAVVATADMFAIGLMKGFYEAGIRVPEDISVMGFDDLDISAYMTPGLTTVRQEISLKGEHAVNLLVQNMADAGMKKATEILPVRIVERESVKRKG
ncbi:MAG: LacI family DNA-binding transcriptional regulator [Lachnospiraceae bacterium]|nr:LacI family DNA-binding transcriptional regulator [Lachnospiraceae bacterium]